VAPRDRHDALPCVGEARPNSPVVAEVQLLAAAIVRALDDERGAGKTVGIEIWHLQSGQQHYVPAADARRRLPDARAILDGYVG
jgi:hypothetical protein